MFEQVVLQLRTILDFLFLLTVILSLFSIFLVGNYARKMLLLSVSYSSLILYFLYIVITKELSYQVFSVILTIFISFIFTFITGVSILMNLLKQKKQ